MKHLAEQFEFALEVVTEDGAVLGAFHHYTHAYLFAKLFDGATVRLAAAVAADLGGGRELFQVHRAEGGKR